MNQAISITGQAPVGRASRALPSFDLRKQCFRALRLAFRENSCIAAICLSAALVIFHCVLLGTSAEGARQVAIDALFCLPWLAVMGARQAKKGGEK